MKTNTPLFLYEEIMLLALRDEEGTIASNTMYHYAIGGAILAELLLSKHIRVDDSKKKLLSVVSASPINDDLMDECLEKMSQAKRRASMQTWVSRFASIKNLKHRVAEQLCRRGILRADEDKVLLIFSRKIYPEMNPVPEKQLIERLRKAIFTMTQDIDTRTAVLVSLANSSGLLRVNFDKRKLKERQQRIEKIIQGDLTGKATKDAIEAMQAAVMVACIMPIIITPTI